MTRERQAALLETAKLGFGPLSVRAALLPRSPNGSGGRCCLTEPLGGGREGGVHGVFVVEEEFGDGVEGPVRVFFDDDAHAVAAHAGELFAEEGVFDRGLKFRSLVLPDVFIDQASPEAMYRVAGLDAAHIEAKVLEVLGVAVVGKRA